MPLTKYHSVLTPTELALLQRVFDQLCQERRLTPKDGEQRERLASELIEALRDGASDEAEMLQSFAARGRKDTPEPA